MKTIIVPYRNRPDHLERFIFHHMGLWGNIRLVIIEQYNDKPFNRGRLLNIGAIEFPDLYYIMHDVDMLISKSGYYDAHPSAEVVQLVKSNIQIKDYLGGVTMFTHPVFHKAGGYHNDYFHRAEDNEMMFNLKRLRIPVQNHFQQFTMLDHPRTNHEFDPALWQKAQQKRTVQNQLAQCEYVIKGMEKINELTTILRVDF